MLVRMNEKEKEKEKEILELEGRRAWWPCWNLQCDSLASEILIFIDTNLKSRSYKYTLIIIFFLKKYFKKNGKQCERSELQVKRV